MIKFSEWMRFREEGAAAGGGGAGAGGAASGGAPSGGGDSGGSPGGSTDGGSSAPPPAPTDGSGTTSSDVARVPMRLGGCGFCYPYCSCSSCKKKKRRKKRRRKKS